MAVNAPEISISRENPANRRPAILDGEKHAQPSGQCDRVTFSVAVLSKGRFRMKAVVAAWVALAALMGSASAQEQGFQLNPDAVDPQATACVYAFSSGSGVDAFNWCLSVNGNIVQLETPAGQRHQQPGAVEGYAVCSATATHASDFAFISPVPLGPPTVLAGCSSGSSCTIQRDSADGIFRLIQKFTQNKKEKELNIDHTLVNMSATTQTAVTLARMSFFSVNGDSFNRADRSARSAWLAEVDRITSTASTFKEAATAFVVDNFPTGCAPSSVATPAPPSAYAIQINYSLGNIAPGKKKLVRVQIRRD